MTMVKSLFWLTALFVALARCEAFCGLGGRGATLASSSVAGGPRRPSGSVKATRSCATRLDAAPTPVTGGSLVALVTPFADASASAVDHGALRALLEWHLEAGTSGIVALGTTGEASTLTEDEKAAVLRTTVDACKGQVPIVVGTGTIDTRATIRATQQAADLGADASLVVTPYYVKPPQKALVNHFEAVADAVDLPLLLYNVPGRTGVDMLPATVAELAAHERIIGIKEATGDVSRVAELRASCGEDFLLLSGDDATCVDFVIAGGDGVISVTTNVAPERMAEVMDVRRHRDDDAAVARVRSDDAEYLSGLHNDLFVQANPIPVKWALSAAGKIGSSSMRMPLAALEEEYEGRVQAAMEKAGVPRSVA